MPAIKNIQTVPYHSKEVDSIIEKISGINLKSSCYLIVFAGRYRKGKEQLLSKISDRNSEISTVDMRSIISSNEEESYRNIDKLFQSISGAGRYLYLENYDVLSGEYTGFTYSYSRYATPQEKYLLKKIQTSEKVVITDIVDNANVHNTLKRYAQVIIGFDNPTGLFGKLFWRLRQIRLHGHTFENKRPLDVR